MTHQLIHGMKGYNGVAILSRLPLEKPGKKGWCEQRGLPARLGRRCRAGSSCTISTFPPGGDIPDPEANPKFAHKLRFLDEIDGLVRRGPAQARRKAILLGDLNIAPLETDVWSHKDLLNVVSHTPIEVEKLGKLQAAGGFVDAVRHFVPPAEKLYSWWSYRAADWRASDRGRRLDHIWVTPALGRRLKAAAILKDARGWELPSDHAPVLVELAE